MKYLLQEWYNLAPLWVQIPIQKLKQAARPTPAPAAKKAPAAADAETAEAGTAAASAPADTAAGAKGRAPRKKFKARHVAGAGRVAYSHACCL